MRNRGERAGAIYADSSHLHIQHNIEFMENEGYDGGAIAFYEEPSISTGYFDYHSVHIDDNVKAIRNHARHYGGALYVHNTESYIDMSSIAALPGSSKKLKCFYKPNFYMTGQPAISNTSLVFINNTSDIAGSAIYGGWVKLCYILGRQVQPGRNVYSGYTLFNQLFQIKTHNSDLSPVSSEPVRVCICSDSKPVCNITYHTVKVYPGETFQISAVGVGQRYGTVPSTIHAWFHQANVTNPPKMETLQHVQIAEEFCTHLSYTVKSPNAVEDLVLLVVRNINENVLDESYDELFDDVVIHIKLQPWIHVD